MHNIKDLLLYASTSANVFNFLGRNDPDRNFRFYQSVIEVASMAHRDLMEFKVEKLKIEDPHGILNFSSGRKPIMITFHTGSYNMLISHLMSNGYQVQVLSDSRSMQLKDYYDGPVNYRKRYRNSCDCTMLNVQEKGFVFRAIQKIKSGYPIVAFIDGNKGIDGLTKDNENLEDIRFCNGMVRVRKGLPYLAYLTGVPVVLALAYKKDDADYLKLFPPIEQTESESRENFSRRCLETVFKWFESHLGEYTDQWASWPYVHYWSDLSKFPGLSGNRHSVIDQKDYNLLTFDSNRFLPLKFNDEFLLFDRTTYTATKIDREDAPLFSIKTSQSDKSRMLSKLVMQHKDKVELFVSKGIFVDSNSIAQNKLS